MVSTVLFNRKAFNLVGFFLNWRMEITTNQEIVIHFNKYNETSIQKNKKNEVQNKYKITGALPRIIDIYINAESQRPSFDTCKVSVSPRQTKLTFPVASMIGTGGQKFSIRNSDKTAVLSYAIGCSYYLYGKCKRSRLYRISFTCLRLHASILNHLYFEND